ncbi:dihydrofolate reductase family protein [Actinopolymorpha sp. B9G3]|uniref:dihydrofolate reductase family protein n=1 Tax=Actinopolymorpha sp. B9G3 TaxID=3158970 RepID=UPI0032D92279
MRLLIPQTAAHPPASVGRTGETGVVVPGPAHGPDLDGADLDDAALAGLYAYPRDRRWVRANFVSTVDGAAQGPDHRSGSISGPADRRILALLRALSDVIVVGAGTARVEGYAPADIRPAFAPLREQLGLPPTPPIAVVTDSLDIPDRLLTDPRTVVLTCTQADPDRRRQLASQVDLATAGDEQVDAEAVVDALTARGYQRILSEGGPTFAGFLARAGLLDELCLTISPELLAGPAMRILTGPELSAPADLRLASLLEADGFLFFRWLFA